MKYLITGGCGFLGSNLAHAVLTQGRGELTLFDDLSRSSSERNLAWLNGIGRFQFLHGDIRMPDDVASAVATSAPDVVFHLAGQVAMTTSLSNPRRDFMTNALGTFNLLEAIRQQAPGAAVLYSSTNKVYGDLEWVHYEEGPKRYVAPDFPDGFPESTPLDFRTPYGTSKGCADQYMLDYHRSYGLRTAVFRHSSMYGSRQFSTFDQGWIGWFCDRAWRQLGPSHSTTPFTISGNGKQVRDVLHGDDMIRLYFAAAEGIDRIQGRAFNVGGGMDNSLSLLELFDLLEELLGGHVTYTQLPVRSSDQKVFVADVSELGRALGWRPQIGKRDGVGRMLDWIRQADL